MRTPWMFFLMAMLGVFGTGRMSDAQESRNAQARVLPAQEGLSSMDVAAANRTETATFALG
jgi:hypothetical protein